MSDQSEINIFKALDWIRDNASNMADAKATRVQLEHFLKSKKAILMQAAESQGYTSSAAQEREALAHKEYLELLNALKEAVATEEKLKWLMTSAELKIEVWRSLESSRRIEAKTL